MKGIILYNKSNTSSFSNHVVTAHKWVFYLFVSYVYVRPKAMAGDDASSIYGSVENPLQLSCRKMTNYESSCTSAMANYFVQTLSYGPNHLHQKYHEDHLAIIM